MYQLNARSLLIALVFLFISPALLAVPAPETNATVTTSPEIGEPFCFTADITNTSADIGYGPYFLMVIDPGMSFESSSFFGTAVETLAGTIGGSGNFVDPVSGDTISGASGSEVYIIDLPVGSVSVGQPPIPVEICLSVDDDSTENIDPASHPVVGVNLSDAVSLYPGFDIGDLPAGDMPILNPTPDSFDVTPVAIQFDQQQQIEDGEVAPGPNFAWTASLTTDVAANKTIIPAPITFPTFTIPFNTEIVDGGDGVDDSDFTMPPGCTIASYTPPNFATGTNGSLTMECTIVTGDPDPEVTDDVKISFQLYKLNTLDMTICDADTSVPVGNEAKHVSINKEVTELSAPGNTINYLLNSTVSEFLTPAEGADGVDAVSVVDIMPDGVTLSSIPEISYNGGAYVAVGAGYTDAGEAADGTRTITFDILTVLGLARLDAADEFDIRYEATIDQQYTSPAAPVLARDIITNNAEITYDIEGIANAKNCTDQGIASVEIEDISILKSLVAVNGTPASSGATIRPEDDVTFRLRLNLPSGDLDDVKLRDYLPLPIFDATTINSTLSLAANPDVDFTAASTWTTDPIAINALPGNGIEFDFGDISVAAQDQILEIDLTVTTTTEPYASGLSLANFMQAETDNTVVDADLEQGIVDFVALAPGLTMDKTITSTTADPDAPDAGDSVTYNIAIAEVNNADAYNVIITDTPDSELISCALDAASLALGSGDIFTTGFTLNQAAASPGIPANGSVNLTMTCTIDNTVSAADSINNNTSVEWNSAFAEPLFFAPVTDDVAFDIVKPEAFKSIVTSSEASTGDTSADTSGDPRPVTIGEIVRFRIWSTVQNLDTNYRLRDLLPDGMQFLDDGTAMVAFVSSTAGNVSSSVPVASICAGGTLDRVGDETTLSTIVPDCVIDASRITEQTPSGAFTNGEDVIFDFDNLTNVDNDNGDLEFVLIELNAIVLDNADTENGSTLLNRSRVIIASATNPNEFDDSAAVYMEVVLPKLQVTKSVDKTVVDLNDQVTFTLVLEHVSGAATAADNSTADAFDVVLRDIVPAGYTYDAASLTTPVASGGGTCTVTNDVADDSDPTDAVGGAPLGLQVTFDELTLGDTCEVEFTATVNASITQGSNTTNTANLDWTNLPGAGTDAAGGNTTDSDTTFEDSDTTSDTADTLTDPELGLAKDLTNLVDNGDGTYTVAFKFVVENSGNLTVNDLQIEDDLAAVFAAATSFSIVGGPSSGALTVNAGFDGDDDLGANPTDIQLLAAGNSLAVGASASIDLSVMFTPGAAVMFSNQVDVTGTTPGGLAVTDTSTNGTEPDPDGDGEPNNNNEPTPFDVGSNPQIAVAKSAGPTVDIGGGLYETTISIVVENIGNVNLANVQTIDDLNATFNSAASFNVTAGPTISGASTVNANVSFNGDTDTNLLDQSTSFLATGASSTITFTVQFDPTGGVQPFNNTATASGYLPGVDPATNAPATTDDSDNGTDTDPDGDGDPSEAGEDDPTPITTAGAPVIGIAKQASPTIAAGGGEYDTTITLVVENLGNTDLTNVQVVDDLTATFTGSSSVVSVTAPVVVVTGTSTVTADAGYDGTGNNNLLAGTETLLVGDSVTISFTVRFNPGSETGPFNNSATANADGASDTSDDGSDPDADNDGNPDEPGENDPTPITFGDIPVIGVAKTATAANFIVGTTYETTFSIVLENLGNVDLTQVQLTESLIATFPAPSTYTITVGPTISTPPATGTLVLNAGFNGNADDDLLNAAASDLPIGESATIEMTVRFDSMGSLGPFYNQVLAAGESPTGVITTDLSDDGTDSDPNGDQDPTGTGEDDPTVIQLNEQPIIGLAKQAGTVTDNGDGTFTVPFTFVVENLGNVDLYNVQVEDDLSATFGADPFTIVSGPSSGSLSIDTNYDGNGNNDLLIGTDTLDIGADATIELSVQFTPATLTATYSNTASIDANSPSGIPVADDSQNGANPDPDSDGIPTNDNEPTPFTVTRAPAIGLAKAASPAVAVGGGLFETVITMTVENLGTEDLFNVQVVDDLATTFAGAASFSVTSSPVITGTTTVVANSSYDGNGNNDLLQSTLSTLAVAKQSVISFTVQFDPTGGVQPFNNTATTSAYLAGVDPNTNPPATTDTSDNGTDADTDGDGNPDEAGENDPTPISTTATPIIGLAKSASPTVTVTPGSRYRTTITLLVENVGNADLTNVQVTDDLSNTFTGTSSVISVTAPVVNVTGTSTLTANAGYTGVGVNTLLSGTDTLLVGDSATITFDVEFEPNDEPGPFNNSATADSDAGGGVSDTSDDGEDVDSDGDGNPDEPGDNDPTPITFGEDPVIGVSKVATAATLLTGTTYQTTFTFVVENLGNVDLTNVQIEEDLNATFPSPVTYSISTPLAVSTPPATGTITLNPTFDGNLQTNMFTAATSDLPIGESAELTMTIDFDPVTSSGPFDNQVQATGTSPSNETTTDLSDNDTDPDANGNNNPNEPGENDPTPIVIDENPLLGLAKFAGAVTPTGTGDYSVPFTIFVENIGNVELRNLQVVEDLAATFGVDPFTITIAPNSTTLATNGAFTGLGGAGNNLLVGTETLAVGASAAIEFTITFTPAAAGSSYTNQVTGTGTSPNGVDATDSSQDGSNPDPDGDNDARDNNDPTPFFVPAMAQIGTAKTATPAIDIGGGLFETTITITVDNLGTQPLANVQVVDDLSATFAGAASFNVSSVPVATGATSVTTDSTFDGSTNTNLLNAAISTLAVGDSAEISFDVQFDPTGGAQPFNNTATSSGYLPGVDPSTNPPSTTDDSDDGTDTDTDGDGNPDEAGENDPTPISTTSAPQIGLAKLASPAVEITAGSLYRTTFTLTLENLGNADLTNVQVVDDLNAAFIGTSSVVSVTVPVVTVTGSSTLNANVAYTGTGVNNLLVGTDTLLIGDSATITFDVEFNPGVELPPLFNSATANSNAGGGVSDTSDDGNDPDADGDGIADEAGENDPSPIYFGDNPVIGVAKNATTPTFVSGSIYSTDISVIVENLGNVALTNVQLVEDLLTTFPLPTTYTIATAPAIVTAPATGTLTLNPTFDGNPDTDLLTAASSDLPVGESAEISFTVEFDTMGSTTPYYNQVVATAEGPSGVTVNDLSDDGNDTDPNGNGDPTGAGEDDPTPISVIENPVLGISKVAGAVSDIGGGSYSVPFTLFIENLGNVELQDLQVTDDLATTFGADPFTISLAPNSPTLTTNAAYTGNGVNDLLAGTDILAIGDSATIEFTVEFTPAAAGASYTNQATAEATSPNGTDVSDQSQNGNDPDPDSDNNPRNNDEPTPFGVTDEASIGIAKNATPAVDIGGGVFETTISFVIENLGSQSLNNVQITDDLATVFAAATSFNVTATPTVNSGTIVANSSFDGVGDQNILNASLSTLSVGATAEVEFTMQFTPSAIPENYSNTASASGYLPGVDPTSNPPSTTDDSDDGTEPDDNGDGDPAENDPTPIGTAATPVIGIAKTASPTVEVTPGVRYSTTITLFIENLGNVDLTNTQVVDDLTATFIGTASVISVTPPAVTVTGTSTLVANAGYTGVGVNTLLSGTDTLLIGDSAEISFDVVFEPNTELGPFNNSATASSDAGGGVSDTSDDGNDPDSDDDGNPDEPGENDPTPITFGEQPVIGVAKSATAAVAQPTANTFQTTFSIRVENVGNVDLTDVQLVEDLATTFPSPATSTVIGVPIISTPPATGTLTLNPNFNVAGDTDLLTAASSDLPTGEFAIIDITVEFNTGGVLAAFFNQVVATGESPSNITTSDLSDDGDDVDPSDNGDPGDAGEDDPTPIPLAENPVIGVAKVAGAVADLGGGNYSVPFTLFVENMGDVELRNVQVVEDLAATFGTDPFTISSAPTSTLLSINPAFMGDGTDNNLLAGTDILAAGDSATIEFTITFTPSAPNASYTNTVNASGTSPNGVAADDDSQNGNNVDPDGNNDPRDNDDPTPFAVTDDAKIGIAKNATPAVDIGGGVFETTISFVIENFGSQSLNNVQITDDLTTVFAAATSFSVTATPTVNSGTIVANSSFDGSTDQNILNASLSTLSVGATAEVEFTMQFTPSALPENYSNTASASGYLPGIDPTTNPPSTTDDSDDGTDPDEDGNTDPTENDPTPIGTAATPVIGLAKTASPTVEVTPGVRYRTTITLFVENLGNVDLTNTQVVDDLNATFIGTSSVISVTPPAVVVNGTSTLTANAGYTGVGANNLLSGTDTLLVGDSAEISFDVEFEPNAELGPFNNSATASSDAGGGVSDTSDDGNDPDSDDDGNPDEPGENDPTPITFGEQPVIGVAKSATAAIAQPTANTFQTTFSVRVENVGNVDLMDVQLVEDLTTTFPSPATSTLIGVPVISTPPATGTLTLNPGFNGAANTNLLTSASSDLPVGEFAIIDITVEFNTGGVLAAFFNQVVATAESPSNITTSDLSDDGSDVDANGNGDPGDADEDDPTPIPLAENPVIGIAKVAGTVTPLTGGDYSVPFTLFVENMGDVELRDVQVVEDLAATFGADPFTISSAPNSTGLTVNPAFTGDGTDNNLLAGTDILAVGDSATIEFTVTFAPSTPTSAYTNTAVASGTSPNGIPVDDDSQDGNNTDPDGNNDPRDNDDPTPFNVTPPAQLGIAKTASPATLVSGSLYQTTITLNVENMGTSTLLNVLVKDDLATTFASAASFNVTSAPVVSGSTTVYPNPAYDGSADTDLLLVGATATAGPSVMASGEIATISFDVQFDPTGGTQPFNNTATTSGYLPGVDPSTAPTDAVDDSDNGTDPDENVDGVPDENDPTPISTTPVPVIGIAKSATPTIDLGGSQYQTTLSFVVENLGNMDLTNVQVVDDLAAVFIGSSTVVSVTTPVVSVTGSSTLTANAGFTGVGNNDLLSGTDTLLIGDSATISFDLVFTPGAEPGPFNNSAVASSDAGGGVTDTSDDGTDPDSDGDGNPDEPGENDPTPISFGEDPVIGVAKAAAAPTSLGGNAFSSVFTLVVENLGNVDLSNVQIIENLASTFPSPATFSVSSAPTVSVAPTAGVLAINAGFNGAADTNIFAAGSTLLVGERAEIEFTVQFDTQGNTNPFYNQVLASASGPGGTTTSDLSDDGSEPDADGNFNPGDAGEDDPTPLLAIPPANLSGTLWLDDDHDGSIGAGEELLEGWTVELFDPFGNLVGTATTDANGNYFFNDVPAGSGYSVRFRHPDTNVVWGELTGLQLDPGDNLIDQNFPIDPQGVVYDAATRVPVEGATLTLINATTGNPLPGVCLLDVSQQNQVTTADGRYRFDIVPGADPECPVGATQYTIVVDPPVQYAAPPSNILGGPVAGGPLNGAACAAVDAVPGNSFCEVQSQNDAPATGQPTQYYLDFLIGVGSQDIVNNHIPLDILATPESIVLSKYASKSQVLPGGLVQYTIRAENQETFLLSDLFIDDNVPAGFTYVTGTGTLIRAGADGILDTPDDDAPLLLEPTVSAVGDLRFEPIDFDPGEVVAVRYMMRVTIGGTKGGYTNIAQTYAPGDLLASNEAQATVELIEDPLLEQTNVIGKVFHDRDGDSYQDFADATDVRVRSDFFGWESHEVGTITGRLRATDPVEDHQVVVRMPYKAKGNNEFHISTAEGTLLKFDSKGELVEEAHTGQKEAGLTGQDLRVTVDKVSSEPVVRDGKVIAPAAAGTEEFVITITNHGIHEEGIPGVRIASVEGLLMETDQHGRYHVAGISTERWERGRNYILKVDKSTLPPEAEFTTENPRVMRLTSSLMNRINFGVKLPDQEVAFHTEVVETKVDKVVSETKNVTLNDVVEPVRFKSGQSGISRRYAEQLQGVISTLSDKQNVRVRFIGHTDSDPLSAKTRAKYRDNQGLSEARAQQVANFMITELNLDPSTLLIAGRADAEPLASNDNEADKQQNRRVEIEVIYDEVKTEEVTKTELRQVESRRMLLPHGGSVWATEDPTSVEPLLTARATKTLKIDNDGNIAEPITFILDSNYQTFINRWELRIYDEKDKDLVRPLTTLVGREVRRDKPVEWDGYLQTGGTPEAGDDLIYVLRVYDKDDHFDQTHPQILKVIDNTTISEWLKETDEDEDDVLERRVDNQLAHRNIPLRGSRVRIHGADISRDYTITIDGENVGISSDNRFVFERQMPEGEHTFTVKVTDDMGKVWERKIAIDVTGKYLFMVGLANLTVGEQDVSGNVSLLANDDHFDGDLWVDGRIAMYLKGKIKGKYLITAQIDTTEDELDKMGDNLSRRDPRALLRRLDPDEYYPVYGDDSTTISDVDTQGAFYVRLDWDKSQALWGNYNTPLTGNEMAYYNRSLYGAQLVYRTVAITEFGDDRLGLYAFGSEANTAQAHNEFVSTGGSLYYLRNTDIVRGSEKMWIEVRDRDTGRVVNTKVLQEGLDYQIDALQGRIILNRPLEQVARTNTGSIIGSQPLNGDNVILLVDYEYVPTGFSGDDVVLGGRVNGWISDHLGMGVTYVTEERDDGEDYELAGVDLTVKAGEGTYIKVEYAQSEATQSYAGWTSTNGGLSFIQSQDRQQDTRSGDAISVEAALNLAELGEGNNHGRIQAWWKEREAGFSSSRADTQVDTTEYGVEADLELNERWDAVARYTKLEQGATEQETMNLQGTFAATDRLDLIGEVRMESADSVNADLGFSAAGEALLGALGFSYEISPTTDIYASYQAVIDADTTYEDNDAFTIGAKSQVSSRLGLKGEVVTGDRGDALTLGVDYAVTNDFHVQAEAGFGDGAASEVGTTYKTRDGTELYGSYAVDTDRTDNEKQTTTIGQRKQFGNATRLYSEQQFANDDEESGVTHIVGIDQKLSENVSGSLSVQHSEIDNVTSGNIERDAATVGLSFNNDAVKASTKLEYRVDSGTENTTQWLTKNAVEWDQTDNLSYLIRLNMSITENDDSGFTDARFTEFDLGFAYRPTNNDRWNILGKYSYLYDLTAQLSTGSNTGQVALGTDERAHILSMEALYQLNQRWELGGKVAYRKGETRVMRGTGPWIESGAKFGALRARYHMAHNWDAFVEYRWLQAEGVDDTKSGALLGVYRHLGDHFKVGLGYNFTEFDADLRSLSYDDQGWFIDIVGKY